MNKNKQKTGTVLFTVLVLLSSFYLYHHLSSWLDLVTGTSCEAVTGLVILLLTGLLFRYSERNLVAENRALTLLTGFTAFAGIYLVMGWLAADLISLFFSPDPLLTGWLVPAAVVFFAVAGMIQAGRISTIHYQVPGFGFNRRIILLSDLHIGYYVGTKQIRKIVDVVDAQNADLVVIAGDMINDGNTLECPEIRETELLLSTLKSVQGVYACGGNHDPDPQDPDFITFLDRSRIHLLQDEAVMVEGLQIAGRNTNIRPRKSLEEMDLKPAKTLLIDHDPAGIREAIDHGIDLVVCGHTHKGQIFPFQLFTRLVYSKSENYGMAVHDHTTSIVSSGAGVFSMPMRLGSRCEVVIIDLV